MRVDVCAIYAIWSSLSLPISDKSHIHIHAHTYDVCRETLVKRIVFSLHLRSLSLLCSHFAEIKSIYLHQNFQSVAEIYVQKKKLYLLFIVRSYVGLVIEFLIYVQQHYSVSFYTLRFDVFVFIITLLCSPLLCAVLCCECVCVLTYTARLSIYRV